MKTSFVLFYWAEKESEFPIVGQFSKTLVELFKVEYSGFGECYLYMILKFSPVGVELVEAGGKGTM